MKEEAQRRKFSIFIHSSQLTSQLHTFEFIYIIQKFVFSLFYDVAMIVSLIYAAHILNSCVDT